MTASTGIKGRCAQRASSQTLLVSAIMVNVNVYDSTNRKRLNKYGPFWRVARRKPIGLDLQKSVHKQMLTKLNDLKQETRAGQNATTDKVLQKPQRQYRLCELSHESR